MHPSPPAVAGFDAMHPSPLRFDAMQEEREKIF
jgi:hypothetical protein